MTNRRQSNRRPSYKLQPGDVPRIKRRLLDGELQSRIAADYDVNSGRISEINTGKTFPEIPPAP